MVKVAPLGISPSETISIKDSVRRNSLKVAPVEKLVLVPPSHFEQNIEGSIDRDIPETLTPLKTSPKLKLPKIVHYENENDTSSHVSDSDVASGSHRSKETKASPQQMNASSSEEETKEETHETNKKTDNRILFHSDSPPIPTSMSDRSGSGSETASSSSSSAGSSFLTDSFRGGGMLAARISKKLSLNSLSSKSPKGSAPSSMFEVILVKRAAKKMTVNFRHRAQCSFCLLHGQCRKCGVLEGVARLQIEEEGRPLLSGVATATWITDSILAMSRPTMRSIPDYRFDEQLKAAGVTAIFNTEEVGEHPYCGGEVGLDGFTYSVGAFESAGIKIHNFGWVDLSTPSLKFMMKAVETATEVLKRGEKLAVHCHAGFGRTGILIACILLNTTSMNATEVIQAVRARRPKSIENRKQKKFVYKFARYLKSDAMDRLFVSDPTSINFYSDGDGSDGEVLSDHVSSHQTSSSSPEPTP